MSMVKLEIGLICIFISVISSCTFHRKILDYTTSEDFYNSINSQGKEREAYITFLNDSVAVGRNFQISSDSSSWNDTTDSSHFVQINSNLKEVMFKHHSRGMINGFLIGLPVGGVFATSVWYFGYGDTGFPSENEVPFYCALGIAIVTPVTCAIIGYNIADKHIYILDN